MSEQAECHEEVNRHRKNAAAEEGDDLGIAESFDARRFHGPFEKKLTGHECNQGPGNKNKYGPAHSFSSNLATGFAVSSRPMTTSAMPHQRRGGLSTPRTIQQLSGIRTSTVRQSGNAIERGMQLRT